MSAGKLILPRIYDFTGSGGGTGPGASTYLQLNDTNNSYAGKKGQIPQVKQTEDGLDFSNTIDGGTW